MTQINPSVTNPTIADLFQRIIQNKLDLSPDFQRKFVWTQEHQEAFLDTILRGYPFPEIYVCQGQTDIDNLITTQKVIDGQQRLTTIKNYIEDTFDKELKTIRSYKELSSEEKESFLDYKIVVRDIGRVDDQLIREIFRRINLTKFKLEDIEIHNAIYDGEFIQTAKDIANEVDLEKFGVFFESEFTRMADILFVLLVMSTIENDGYFQADKEVENYIARYNEEYPNKDSTKKKVLEVFRQLENLELELDSIWFRKSNFFTIVVEMAWLEKIPEDFKEKLGVFEESILANKHNKSSDYGVYYGYMYAGTNNRKARITRSEFFRKYVIG